MGDKKDNPQGLNWTSRIILIALLFQVMTALSYHRNINRVWSAVHHLERIQFQQSQLLDQRLALQNQWLTIQRNQQFLEILDYLESLINTQ